MASFLPPLAAASVATPEAGWLGPIALALGGAIAGVLAWQLRRSRREHAFELEERDRRLAEEREKARLAARQSETLASESQAKSEMLATLSRNIRAHLNGIMGSADLLLDNSLSPSQREHVTTLRASAESLHQSLNDVLDYSSIETGQITIEQAPFDLRQPLIAVIEHLSPLSLLKGLELVLIVAPDVPLHVTGDAGRLRQILLNLVSNAVKFTPRGRVVLRVEPGSGPPVDSKPGAGWLHFSISDTGTAIPEEMKDSIFDRFAHSDSTAARKFGGSGLELAISKRLVGLMGGRIGARNLPESGSEFWVELALPAEKAQPAVDREGALGLHVVVLDRLSASRLAASALLKRLGIEHDLADTLASAVELLRDAREAEAREIVMLVDEDVANDHATELTRLMVTDPVLQAVRLVLMSRHPDAKMAASTSFAVTAVLRKPLLRTETLLEAIKGAPIPQRTQLIGSRPPFEPCSAPASPEDRGPRVLVVDDDEISRSVASQLLIRLGCIVELAVSGMEAIERARNHRFGLIFMDCQMPEMDGYTTTQRIRAAAGERAPPIVALTANTSAADRERCFAAGMCDFVEKPVRKAVLARVLKRWIASEPVGAG
jgi:two-component system, sensor histidine kinase and response regulator